MRTGLATTAWPVAIVAACGPKASVRAPAPSHAPTSSASAVAAPGVVAASPPSPSVPVPSAKAAAPAQCAAIEAFDKCIYAECGWCGATGVCLGQDGGAACAGGFTRSLSGSTLVRARMLAADAAGAARAKAAVDGMQTDGAEVTAHAESPREHRFAVRRGRCYAIVMHVPYGTWFEPRKQPWAMTSAPHVGGGEADELYSWYWLRKFCPQDNGQIVAWAGSGDQPKSARPPSGKGPWTMQLYSSPISDAELRRDAARAQKDNDDALARAFCAACYRDLSMCLWSGEPGCHADFAECLRGNRLTAQSCEEGHFARPSPPPAPPPGVINL